MAGVDSNTGTSLMYDMARGNEDTALAKIEHSTDLDLNAVDNQGQTALMMAVNFRMIKVAIALTKRGADVNIKDNEDGETALMYAISQGNDGTALAIIEHSKDLDWNAVDNRGETALMKIPYSFLQIAIPRMTYVIHLVTELIKRGADVNIKDKDGETALMYAISRGNDRTALAIIEHSTDLDLNAVDNRGETALMIAARLGMNKVSIKLTKRGADVNIKDNEDGETALMYAISQGNEDTALAIIEHSTDLDLNAVDNRSETALKKATSYEKTMTRVVLELSKRGVDVNIKDKEGKTALMYAVAQNNDANALAIIEHSKDLDLNAVDNRDETALMIAARLGMTEVTIALTKRGADVNIEDKHGETALMYALSQGNENTALAIIEHSTDLDLDAVDSQGQTAFIKAMFSQTWMAKVILELIKRGDDVNIKDEEGKTALMYAIAMADPNITLAIIDRSKELDFNVVDTQGRTALINAVILRMTEVTLALIKRGVDVNIKDKKGKTALMYAIARSDEDTALAIIEHSKDLDWNAVDNRDETALMIAARLGMTEVTIALTKRGADVNIEYKHGETALMYAIALAYEDTALAIIEHSTDLDLNAVDYRGHTAFIKAMFSQTWMAKVILALIKRGEDVNIKDEEGKTALMYAIVLDDEDASLAIIKHGKDLDLNIVDNHGQTALIKATSSETSMTSVVLELIKRGADVNIKDKEGKTALMYAVAQFINDDANALAIIEHSKDLDLNAVDNRDETALMMAVNLRMTEVTIVLTKRGADVNIKDKDGKTPLMYALSQGNEDTALAIIEHSKDLDLNAVDNRGETALMKAAANHDTVKVALLKLIKLGADVNMTDKEGKSTLMFIGFADACNEIYNFHAGLLTIELINVGADVNKIDDKGNTALMYNVKYEDSTRALIEKGKALIDQRNLLGRTALFYALVKSISSARYLVENGANLKSIDNYNVSVLSYFIHQCMENGLPLSQGMLRKFDILIDKRIKKTTVVKTIINVVFCKMPLAFVNNLETSISLRNITSFVRYAADVFKKRFSFSKRSRCRLFDELVHISDNLTCAVLEKALGNLLNLGADVNTSDEKGNTISHYMTLLGIFDDRTEEIWKVFLFLVDKGLKTNQKICDSENPLLFMLSNAVKHGEHRRPNMEYITKMCEFLLQKDATLAKDTSQNGDSVFHLVIKIYANVKVINDEYFERCILELLDMFSRVRGLTVNTSNVEMNTPLHILTASIKLKVEKVIYANVPAKVTWQGPSEKILDHLLSCGAALHVRNLKGETPLHVCRTWTAVQLLVKSGETINDKDSEGRNPLLSAAQKSLFLKNPGCFYPDVSPSELLTLWKEAVDMGFDLWTCDKNGDSIISNLIKRNSFELADSLIQITCDNRKTLSDDTLERVLNAVCKDDSNETTWKSILVDKLLKSIRRPLDVRVPLQSCCINIKGQEEVVAGDSSESNSVHYQIAKKLLIYRYDSAESCLHIAEGCPVLQALLSSKIRMDDVPLVIPWTAVSKRYETMLAEVARRQNCKEQGSYWYHSEYIARGAFGHVFVGIHEKDGMEVAIKKVNNLLINRAEDLREIRAFARLPNCEHIVRYLTFLESSDFSYIIMELMEGNLVEYFSSGFEVTAKTMLCRDVTLGLKYLHEQKIIHRDLKPNNILFRTHPEFRLKIADFGLSRRLDINASFTVMATGVGTRGWIASEVMKSASEHSMSSDVFSLGLILHYVLSKDHRNPFSPADCIGKSELEIIPKTEINILNNKMQGWDYSLGPEASHLIRRMLKCTNEKERPTASMVSEHPMFWSKKKKLDFLSSVGNQEEFECPRAKRTAPLTIVEQDLENKFATIVKLGKFNDPRYKQTSVIFIEMQKPIVKHDKKGKPYTVPTRKYDIGSAVELVRFIRNAIAHVSEASRPAAIRTTILEDAVFLDEFPSLVMEVFKAVSVHGWDVYREEIKHVLAND